MRTGKIMIFTTKVELPLVLTFYEVAFVSRHNAHYFAFYLMNITPQSKTFVANK